MFRTRIVWTFLGSMTLLVGGAVAAEPPPTAGETGGQTYGGATYDKAGETTPAAEEMPAEQKETDIDTNINVTPAPSTTTTTPVIEHETTVTTPAPVMTVEPVIEREDARLMTPFGMSFSVSGGVVDFVDDSMDDLTRVGGSWDARLTIGSRLPIALEAAYIGSAQEIDALGLDPNATLVSNGVEGALRLNLGRRMIQPFIFAGGAWQRYDLVGEDFNTSSVRSRDDIFALPVGAGIAFKYRGLLLDARVTYRETWGNQLMQQPTANSGDDDVELNQFMGSARVGFEF